MVYGYLSISDMSRLSCTAIILRTRQHGESDLIIDLFTESHGRTTVIAKGALKSKRRYMGVLEVGHILKVDYPIKSGLSVLGHCDVIQGQWKIRHNLQAVRQLYYILEICLITTPYEEKDLALFQSLIELISALESEPGLTEKDLLIWELRLLSHLGYHLKIDRCPFTNDIPDGLSYQAGGTISSSAGKPYWPVRTEALRVLYKLQHCESLDHVKDCFLTVDDEQQLRQAFVGLWSEIGGRPLKSPEVFKQVSRDILSSSNHTNASTRLSTQGI